MWPRSVPPPQLVPSQSTLRLILSEVTEGEKERDLQVEPFRKVPEESSSLAPWPHLYRQLRGRVQLPLTLAGASEAEGGPGALGEGIQLGLAPPFREDVEGNRMGG